MATYQIHQKPTAVLLVSNTADQKIYRYASYRALIKWGASTTDRWDWLLYRLVDDYPKWPDWDDWFLPVRRYTPWLETGERLSSQTILSDIRERRTFDRLSWKLRHHIYRYDPVPGIRKPRNRRIGNKRSGMMRERRLSLDPDHAIHIRGKRRVAMAEKFDDDWWGPPWLPVRSWKHYRKHQWKPRRQPL